MVDEYFNESPKKNKFVLGFDSSKVVDTFSSVRDQYIRSPSLISLDVAPVRKDAFLNTFSRYYQRNRMSVT